MITSGPEDSRSDSSMIRTLPGSSPVIAGSKLLPPTRAADPRNDGVRSVSRSIVARQPERSLPRVALSPGPPGDHPTSRVLFLAGGLETAHGGGRVVHDLPLVGAHGLQALRP